MPRKEEKQIQVALTLPYPPALNRLWRNYRGRVVLSEEGRTYKSTVGYDARSQGAFQLTGAVGVEVKVFRPRKARDLDANFKVLLDALNNVAWEDDSQIVEIHAYRFEDKQRPRIELVAWEVE
jgi:Holliday junction resolvase RusA-like endonuclease